MTLSTKYIDELQDSIGVSVEMTGEAEPEQIAKLAALLDRAVAPALGDRVPPLWHWTLLTPKVRQSDLAIDGHPNSTFFPLPPEGSRRMWAAGKISFHQPLRCGQRLRKTSLLKDVKVTSGRSGPLLFVTLAHNIHAEDELAIVEEQTLVYRNAAAASAVSSAVVLTTASTTAPTTAWGAPRDKATAASEQPATHEKQPQTSWATPCTVDPRALMRYSALTFNTHRIHYDRNYAMSVEGYDGLVVQGPFLATLMMESFLQQQPTEEVRTFSFRAVSPLTVKDVAEHFEIRGHVSQSNSFEISAVSKQEVQAMLVTLSSEQQTSAAGALN